MADIPDTQAPGMRIQLCYALPDTIFHVDLHLASGSTLEQAIDASGALQRFPEIDLTVNKVGIFGKQKAADTVLRDGDRVEIYRPLQADPKESRRNRARRNA